MRHGSLFSGGGGFDLAAEKMGWQNIFHCEKDVFCQTILQHYWPDTAMYKDIGDFDATPYKGKIDIITGGFPCQPFSVAEKRAGTADDRYLWPAMYRVIREVKPRWVVCENVYGLLNWSEGLVFDKVQFDLEAEGYEVAAYVLPASGVNARTKGTGYGLSADLPQLASQVRHKLLPTPIASDCNHKRKTKNWRGDDLGSRIQDIVGKTGRLNPRFVGEMMGFPPDWTVLPFQSGATKPSACSATPSCLNSHCNCSRQ